MTVLINKLLVELSANIKMIIKIKLKNKRKNIIKITKNKLNYTRNNIIKIKRVNLNYNELIKYFFIIIFIS